MTRTVVGFIGLLTLLPAIQAQNKPGTPTPAQQYHALAEVATQRDVYDEELILELAGQIRTRQRLDMLYALAVAKDQALGARKAGRRPGRSPLPLLAQWDITFATGNVRFRG